MFPQAFAPAVPFDTPLMCLVQSVIAREVHARGIPLVLSPVVDIVRDPRWGRIEECWGEDTFLCAEMGVAAVEGLQGPGRLERLAEGKVFATLKHMTATASRRAATMSPPRRSRRDRKSTRLNSSH